MLVFIFVWCATMMLILAKPKNCHCVRKRVLVGVQRERDCWKLLEAEKFGLPNVIMVFILEWCCAGSFAGLGYLSLYLIGKLGVFDKRGSTYRVVIIFLPLLAATLVAVSRADNYQHSWWDCVFGAFLGWFTNLYHLWTILNGIDRSMSIYPWGY